MGKNILIVEDDPFTKQFYKYIFSKTQYNVAITEDGSKIFDDLRNNSVDLLILDINLKNTYIDGVKVDGIQISRMIKNDESLRAIPIIFVTAYQIPMGKNSFFEEGDQYDYIIKPIVDFNELLQKVDNLLNNVD